MNCPFCEAETQVTDSRPMLNDREVKIGVKRRRKCVRGHVFTTVEEYALTKRDMKAFKQNE